jgi:prefoldin subunit 5
VNPEDEVNALKSEASFLKGEIDAINKRIEELESDAPAS